MGKKIRLLDEEVRILTIDEVEGPNRLKIFDKLDGLRAKPTDFAYALGADLFEDPFDCNIPGRSGLSSGYYVKGGETEFSEEDSWYVVLGDNVSRAQRPADYSTGVRLVANLPYGIENEVKHDTKGIPFVYYKSYPQKVAKLELEDTLSHYESVTGKKYVVPDLSKPAYKKPIIESSEKDLTTTATEVFNDEYGTYVRLVIKHLQPGEQKMLNSPRMIQNGDIVRFKVGGIKWYIDEQTGLMVSERILSAGIPLEYLLTHKDNVKRLTKKPKND